MQLDRLARRYGVLPTELLALTPEELRLVADCADAGVQADGLRRDAALQGGAQAVVVIGER